jgi:8-oxo-dGTP diphosphatase
MTSGTTANGSSIERYVVGAVVIRDGKALLLRRQSDDFLGGLYELPSGVVENGETFQEALRREVREETSLTITQVERELGTFDYRSRSGRPTRQVNYVVRAEGDEIVLSEHDDHRWIGPSDLNSLNVSTETRDVLSAAWNRSA